MKLLRRAWPVPALVVVAVLAALMPSWGDDGPGPGEADVTVSGSAVVRRRDGKVERVEDRTTLRRGDTIEVTSGRAGFELADGVSLEGRAGGAGRHHRGTTLRMGAVPSLEAGELLVTAERRARITSAGTTVALMADADPPAALRASRTVGLRVSVYRGRSALDSAGQRGTIRALRRMEVAAPGELPRAAAPLRYLADDPWDRRFLGPAVALDRQLRSLLAGYKAARAGAAGARSARYLRSVVPDLVGEPALTRLVTGRRAADDVLVGAVIASLGERGTFAERWAAVFAFHDDGATWGLAALDQGVDADDVVDAVVLAVNGTDFPFESAAAPVSPTSPSPPRTVPSAPPGSSTTLPGPAPTTSPPPAAPTSPPPAAPTSPPPAAPPTFAHVPAAGGALAAAALGAAALGAADLGAASHRRHLPGNHRSLPGRTPADRRHRPRGWHPTASAPSHVTAHHRPAPGHPSPRHRPRADERRR